MNNLINIAEEWTQAGYSVIPLRYRSKKASIKWEEYQNRLPIRSELLQWYSSNLRNIGLIVGNGLVVVDFDSMDIFWLWYSEYWRKDTYMVKTRRGVHVYLNTRQPVKNYHNEFLDVKAERGYVLIPPSIHPSGYQYEVLQDAPILEVEKLSDVLPVIFTPEPKRADADIVIKPVKPVYDDPWEAADKAVNMDMGVIKTIREKISIFDLVKGALPSSLDGRWYTALCPFHDDHTPSFWIDTEKGLCGCRKCNIKNMDVINLYARLNQVDNRTAIMELSKRCI